MEPSPVSLGTPDNLADYWPEAVGYGQADPGWAPAPERHSWQEQRDWREEHSWQVPQDWQEGHSWQEPQDWQDWGPPPSLPPEHPSAPLPRVRFAADHPSWPMPAFREPAAPDRPPRRSGGSPSARSAPPPAPDAGYHNGNRRLHAVPDYDPAVDHAAAGPQTRQYPGGEFPGQPADLADLPRRETTGYRHQPGPVRRDAGGHQRRADPGWQEATGFRHEADPSGPRPGPATGQFQSRRSPARDSMGAAGRVLTLADSHTTQVTQEARNYAAAIRQAAEREAAAITQQATSQAAEIREAAEREAAELRARLDSMSGELRRVAEYVTDGLAAPAMPATAPALPDAEPAHPRTRSAPPATRPTRPTRPDTRPARPATRPTGPATRPDTRPARPNEPATPRTPQPTPAGKPQKRPRQLQAMRVATYSTAALLSFAVISGAAEVGLHGYKFFVFRGGGVGQTPGDETDQQFLAREAAAAHHDAAPKGRHARKSHQLVHNNG